MKSPLIVVLPCVARMRESPLPPNEMPPEKVFWPMLMIEPVLLDVPGPRPEPVTSRVMSMPPSAETEAPLTTRLPPV